MSNTGTKVQQHFDLVVDEFDSIYSGAGKGAFGRFLDRIFRRDMYQRLELTLDRARPAEGRRYLDIGCGTGRFCIPLAREGGEVVGLDFAPSMVARAREMADEAGVGDRCTFEVGDFMEYPIDSKFTVTMAIGVFDYLDNAQVFLDRMAKVTTDRWIGTFPCRMTWRAPIRKLRLGLRGCPVFFFSKGEIERMVNAVGSEVMEIRRVGKLYFVVGKGTGRKEQG